MTLNPLGVNNLGEWSGKRMNCDVSTFSAVRWSPLTGVVDLPVPAGTTTSESRGINDRGTVIGNRAGQTDGQYHDYWACIWKDGTFIEVPPLGGNPATSYAFAINNADWVVGERWIAEGQRVAFIWRDGELTTIDPAPYGRNTATARAVSDSGWVVGFMGGKSSSAGIAFRWKDGNLEFLSPLAGAINSVAYGIDDRGIAVGFCKFGTSTATYVPTVWDGEGNPHALPIIPGYVSGVCRMIGGDGVILGEAQVPTQTGQPSVKQLIWIGGVVHEFKPMVTSPGGTFGNAYAISDNGLVVGTGYPPGDSGIGVWLLTPTGSSADLNNDCIVDGADLQILLSEWGAGLGGPADLDYSGLVDGADLGALLGAWQSLSQ